MECERAIIDATYEGKDRVRVKIKIASGEIIYDNSFLPYFYLLPDGDLENTARNLEIIDVDGKKPEKIEVVERKFGRKIKKFLKITVSHPSLVPKFRELVKPFGKRFEMDIPFIRRYFIDRDLEQFREITEDFKRGNCEIEPKILAFDIETIGDGGIDAEKNPIIMVSFYGKDFAKVITWAPIKGEFIKQVPNERILIKELIKTIEDYNPDILVGYNSDSFDWPYIKTRAEKYGIELKINGNKVVFVRRGIASAPKIFGMQYVDLYVFVRNILSPYLKSESLDLNSIAKELLGEEKIDIGGAKGISEAWEKDQELLYKYSLQDAKITYHLAEEVLPMIIQLAKIVGLLLYDVSRFTPSQAVEWLLIKEAFKEGMIVPNRPKEEEIDERKMQTYEGAFVKEPLRGLHEPIAVCDFRSLYPTIIIAHNISPETARCEHEDCKRENMAPNGVWFCRKEEGFLPKTIRKLLDERVKLKKKLKQLDKGSKEYKLVDTRQKALKLILNSFYGYMGFPGARWYAVEAASAVTSLGRKYITEIMKEAERWGFIVVYGDTDSIMLTSKDKNNFEERVKEFLKYINGKLPDPMELELEGFYTRGLFVTKKRYALLAKDGSLVVKGLERVRRDWCNLARKAQEDVLRFILNNEVDKAREYVRELMQKLKRKEIPIEELIIKTQLTKPVNSYESIAPHVKVARDLIKMGKRIEPGTIIEYVIAPGPGKISDKAVAAEFAKDYDPEYYIENQLLPAVKRILDAATKGRAMLKQASLDSFF